MARITVAVPVYNKICFLDECVESVLKQSIKVADLLLVDDGSTDGSSELIDAYAKKYDFITAVHHTNRGLLQSRRRALRNIDGGYVVFLDADDYLRNDAIEILLDAIELSHNADIYAFGLKKTTKGRSYTKTKCEKQLLLEEWSIEEARKWLLRGNSNNLCGKAIKRKCFDDQLKYSDYGRLMHGEDLLQSLEVFDNAESFALVNEDIYFYRQSRSNSTAQYNASQLHDLEIVVHKLLKYGKQWTGHLDDAVVGGLIQYCVLYCLLEYSQGTIDYQADRNEIRRNVIQLLKTQPLSILELKPHYRALAKAISDGRMHKANLIAKTIQILKSAAAVLR